MKLYSYWRSTTAYRVRIAINLKGLSYETVPVPALDDGVTLTQSMSIPDYLERVYPIPKLLPDAPIKVAKVRASANDRRDRYPPPPPKQSEGWPEAEGDGAHPG